MLKSGITVRWLLTTILVIALILTCISGSIVLILRNYYYDTVENKLQSLGQSGVIADYFSSYLSSSSDAFSSRAQEYVDNFQDINVAELWVINKYGNVIVTSTGFISENEVYPDYFEALDSVSGRAFWQGTMSSGEKVMALSVLLPKTNGFSNGAVRYIISLEPVDLQIVKVTIVVSAVSLFALMLVVLSGLFFIRSIVVPVKNLNAATRSIAKGNYSEKIILSNKYDDELAELAESINYMTDEIDKTDKLKNEFISTVSHELRTPLTAIKGWTETLLCISESEDETINNGLKVIQNETERLYTLVEDLLDFSRMESGRMTLHLQKIDIIAELDDAVYVLKDRATREGREIFYSSPDFPAPVNADPDRIKQVFVNIIDNAIKYTPAGGRISIVAMIYSDEVRIRVADTGCGISPEDLPHVKEKFYKANLSAKGSGIGLAVCDEIVTLHKGTLEISSVLGEGTEVNITLPTLPVNLSERKDS
ncbi:MAG: HAMP domain-containing histidine kinase [Clostridia bacterium]|nr:HAMP domain-containing histidine kinase [Oscillospiraceae bacterium]MBR2410648.1 HAMP domain-containing histidine kinase [Clostridia bacterium]